MWNRLSVKDFLLNISSDLPTKKHFFLKKMVQFLKYPKISWDILDAVCNEEEIQKEIQEKTKNWILSSRTEEEKENDCYNGLFLEKIIFLFFEIFEFGKKYTDFVLKDENVEKIFEIKSTILYHADKKEFFQKLKTSILKYIKQTKQNKSDIIWVSVTIKSYKKNPIYLGFQTNKLSEIEYKSFLMLDVKKKIYTIQENFFDFLKLTENDFIIDELKKEFDEFLSKMED